MISRPILIIGPGQVGKSTLFRSMVSEIGIKTFSYPGSSIDLPFGETWIGAQRYILYDTPAVGTLIPTNEEESVVLRFLLREKVERVILVMDENTIADNILLLIQLAEIRIPFVVAIYKKTGFSIYKDIIDTAKIESLFNTRVSIVTPLLNMGMSELNRSLRDAKPPRWVGNFKPAIETIIMSLESLLKKHLPTSVSLRFLAISLVLNCREIRNYIRENVSEKTWLKILHYLKRVHSLNNAFYIANRISEAQEEIVRHVTLPPSPKNERPLPRWLAATVGSSSTSVLIVTLLLWYYLVIKFGSDLLVKFFYNTLTGKYLEPALSALVKSFHNNFWEALIIGKYGLFTIWFSYSFAIILPTLIVFFLIFSLLNESGLFTRLAIFFNSFLRFFGLSGYSMSILTLSSSCKVISFLKTKLINDPKEKQMILLISTLAIPCIAQLGIISLTAGLLPWPLFVFLLFLVLGQALLAAALFKKRNYAPDFIVPISPVVLPSILGVLRKSWNYIFWYIREATPLLLIGNLILFALSYSGLLDIVRNILEPLFVLGLELPKTATEAFFLGFFRKDLGAIFLYDLINTAEMNNIQLTVSLVYLITSIPCIGVTLVLMKRRGLWFGLKITLYSLLYSYSLAYLVNQLLRI